VTTGRWPREQLNMIRQLFPKSVAPPALSKQVVVVFESAADAIDSEIHDHKSNEVLRHVSEALSAIGCIVDVGKRREQKIRSHWPTGKRMVCLPDANMLFHDARAAPVRVRVR
jgi:hypothetical protein